MTVGRFYIYTNKNAHASHQQDRQVVEVAQTRQLVLRAVLYAPVQPRGDDAYDYPMRLTIVCHQLLFQVKHAHEFVVHLCKTQVGDVMVLFRELHQVALHNGVELLLSLALELERAVGRLALAHGLSRK